MSDSSTSQWKLIGVALLSALVTLIAAAVPWMLDRFSSSHDLVYTYSGPVRTESGFAYSVVVQNNGRSAEAEIELWLPVPASPQHDYEVSKDGRISTKELPPLITIEVSVPASQRVDKDDPRQRVIEIPSLRPNESAAISVLAAGGEIGYLNEYLLEHLRLVSKETVGHWDKPDLEMVFIYKVGSSLFVLFFVFLFCYSIYYEHFMPHATKEKYLLEQIDKLGKRKP